MKGGAMQHYYVIAERGDGRTWWLSFPDLPGVYSAAFDPADIQAQVRDALDTAVDAGMALPRSIEDGAMPPADLSEFEEPTVVVVVPYEVSAETKAAA
jgi:predicted RNase H-like HicB family nuclease